MKRGKNKYSYRLTRTYVNLKRAIKTAGLSAIWDRDYLIGKQRRIPIPVAIATPTGWLCVLIGNQKRYAKLIKYPCIVLKENEHEIEVYKTITDKIARLKISRKEKQNDDSI